MVEVLGIGEGIEVIVTRAAPSFQSFQGLLFLAGLTTAALVGLLLWGRSRSFDFNEEFYKKINQDIKVQK